MPLTTIRSPPALDSFIPLTEHQSQTPTSFFGAKPVLYCYIAGARALVSKDQTSTLPLFSPAGERAHDGTERTEPSDTVGQTAEEERQAPVVAVVDVFVNSEYVFLSSNRNSHPPPYSL
jgi:chloride channel, nucleotide-sensitive, 1A